MDTRKIKCVIFDCDGTLVDSERLTCQALVDVFASYGADINPDEYMSNFQGGKMFDILKQTSERAGVLIPMEILEPRFRERLNQLFDEHLKPIPFAVETVQKLQELDVEVCVASNGPQSKMKHSLELTGLLPFFENKIFSAFDINSWKPEPDLLLYAAMQMGYRVEECLFVDDTETGVMAGLNAGLTTVYFSPQQQDKSPGLNDVYCVQCLSEIPEWFSVQV